MSKPKKPRGSAKPLWTVSKLVNGQRVSLTSEPVGFDAVRAIVASVPFYENARVEPANAAAEVVDETLVDPAPSRARVDAAAERHSDSRIPAVLEHIRTGTPIKNAFALEGIPKRTAYAWMEASEQLRDDVDQARAVASEARRKRFEADPSAPFLHYMQTLDPENFPAPKQRVEQTGADGGAQQHELKITIGDAIAGATGEEPR